jgi:hypothetical protein
MSALDAPEEANRPISWPHVIPDDAIDDALIDSGYIEGSRQWDQALGAIETVCQKYEKAVRELQHKAWTEGAMAHGPMRNSPYGNAR